VDDSSTVIFHSFSMSDVEDPYLMAADPIWQWQQTPAGQWAMTHSLITPVFQCDLVSSSYSHRITIYGKLSAADRTYWALKYAQHH